MAMELNINCKKDGLTLERGFPFFCCWI